MLVEDMWRIGDHTEDGILWLINLRWIAAVCLAVVITGVFLFLNVRLVLLPLYIGSLVLLSLNALYYFLYRPIHCKLKALITLNNGGCLHQRAGDAGFDAANLLTPLFGWTGESVYPLFRLSHGNF